MDVRRLSYGYLEELVQISQNKLKKGHPSSFMVPWAEFAKP